MSQMHYFYRYLSLRSLRLERVGRGLLLPVVPSEALTEGVLIAWNVLVQDLLIFELPRSPYTGSPYTGSPLSENTPSRQLGE